MIEARRLIKEIEVPEGVEVKLEENILTFSSNGKDLSRKLFYPTLNIQIKEGKVLIEPKKFSKREKKIINTFQAHILNMIKGVQEGWEYKVEICSSHFPMNVSVEGDMIVVKNFFGEKVPRKAKIIDGVEAKLEGNIIILKGMDKEKVGQTAGNCEKATRITNRDKRRFQDGLWITYKAGKDLI